MDLCNASECRRNRNQGDVESLRGEVEACKTYAAGKGD